MKKCTAGLLVAEEAGWQPPRHARSGRFLLIVMSRYEFIFYLRICIAGSENAFFFEKLPIAYMHQPTPVVSSALCLCVPSIRSTSSTDEKTRHYLRQRSDESDGQTKETEIREAQAAFLHPTRCAWVCSAGCAPSPRDSQRISCREHTFLFFSHNI